MKKAKGLLMLWLAAVLLFGSLSIAPIAPIAKASASDVHAVPIKVDWSQTQSVTTPFSFGLNAFKMFDPNVSKSLGYNKNMAYMKPGFVRIHGLELMKDSKDPDDNRGWLDTANQTWDAAKINEALSGLTSYDPVYLIDIPDFPSWMKTYEVKNSSNETVVKLLDPSEYDRYADFCAELVRIVNIQYGHKVMYWEATNERDDPYYVHLKNAGLADKLDELITIYNKAAKAMKQVDPSIKTGGLAFARGDLYEQVKRFIQGTKNEGTLDFLSYHFYASGEMGETDEHIFNRVYLPQDPEVGTFAKHTRDIRDIVDEEVPDRHVPIFSNEYNVSWTWTNSDPRMRDHRGGVFDALGFIYGHDNGADGFNGWNERDGVYGKTDDNNNLRTPAHVYQLFNNYLIGDRVFSQSGDESKIAVFPIKNGHNQSIAIVNRSSETVPINGDFDHGAALDEIIKEHQVSEAGYAITTTSWEQIQNGQYAVPPLSVTVLTNSSVVPSILPSPLPVITPGTVQQPTGLLNGTDKASPSAVDLTSQGNLDWVYFGKEVPDSVDRKQNNEPLISMDVIGNGGLSREGDLSTGIYWSDGHAQSAASASNLKFASSITTKDNKFRITVPADLSARTLKLYLGVKGVKGTVTATLSDSSAAPYTVTLDNSAWITDKEIVLQYYAASPGQTLTVEYELNYAHWNGGGLRLQAAALSEAQSSGGLIDASVSPSTSVNLTAEGTQDWVHWGLANADSVTKKDQADSLISTITKIGTPSFESYQGDWWGTHKATWTDGAANASVANTSTALKSVGNNSKQGMGFEFTVPADQAARTLKIYLGALGARGELTATLSDGSAPAFQSGNENSPNKIENSGGAVTRVVTLNYRAASDGETLTVKYVLGWDHWGSTIWMQGATLALADLVPPGAPANPAIMTSTSTTAAIDWDEALDNVGISAYEIYNGGERIGITKGTSYFIKGLLPGRSYPLMVKAKDQAGNYSAGATLIIETQPDLTAPTIPGSLSLTDITSSSLRLDWRAAFDNIGVTGYDIYRNGLKLGTTTDTHFEDAAIAADTVYRYEVVAWDAEGNRSAPAVVATLDLQAPTWPAESVIEVSDIQPNQFTIQWPSADDQTLVQSYHIQRDGNAIATVAGSTYTYTLTGLTPDTVYSVKLDAADIAGNHSLDGPIATVRTLPASNGANTVGNPVPPVTAKQILTSASLQNLGSNAQSIRLLDGKTILGIAEATLPLLAGKSLEVQTGSASITLSAAVIGQLTKLQAEKQGEIQLAIESPMNNSPAGKGMQPAGKAYQFSAYVVPPDGKLNQVENFIEPVKLSIRYDAGSDAELLGIYRYNAASKKWEYVNGIADTQAGTLMGSVDEAGTYGIFALKKEYTDVNAEHWAHRAVQVLSAKHAVFGITDSRFAPNKHISRAEFVTIIARALQLDSTGAQPFKDIHANAYYADSVAAAFEAGIIKGKHAEQFAPDASMTREEVAVILVRAAAYLQTKGEKTDAHSSFMDESKIAGWAKQDVLAAQKQGIMTGNPKGQFLPKAAITRAETVQSVYQLLQLH